MYLYRNSISYRSPCKRQPLTTTKTYNSIRSTNQYLQKPGRYLFWNTGRKTYLLGMYREAKKAGDTPMMLDALNDLACGEAKEYRMDSAYHYMNLIKATHNVKEIIPLSAYLHMRFSICYAAITRQKRPLRRNCSLRKKRNRTHHLYTAKSYKLISPEVAFIPMKWWKKHSLFGNSNELIQAITSWETH